jgi:hypothetical protein
MTNENPEIRDGSQKKVLYSPDLSDALPIELSWWTPTDNRHSIKTTDNMYAGWKEAY